MPKNVWHPILYSTNTQLEQFLLNIINGLAILKLQHAIGFLYISNVARNFLTDSFNCFIIQLLICALLVTEIWYMWSLTNLRGTCAVGLGTVRLPGSLLCHILQAIKLETLIQKRTDGPCNVERISLLLENRLCQVVEILTRRKCAKVGNNRLFRLLYHCSGTELRHHQRAQQTILVLHRSPKHVFQCFLGFLRINYECSKSFQVLRRGRHILRKRRQGSQNQIKKTCCPGQSEEGSIVEHNIVGVTYIFLISSTEPCELDSPERFVQSIGEWLVLPSLSSKTILGAGRSSYWLFSRSARKLGSVFQQFCFIPSLGC